MRHQTLSDVDQPEQPMPAVAALLGGFGAFCGAIVNVVVYPSLAAAAAAHLSPGAAAKVLMTAFNSGFGHVFTYFYFASESLAPLLMAVALWRSRNVPRWLVALFLAGLEVAQQMGSFGPIVALYMPPLAVAMVPLAVRIWQAAAQPASHRQEPATMPLSSPCGEPVRESQSGVRVALTRGGVTKRG